MPNLFVDLIVWLETKISRNVYFFMGRAYLDIYEDLIHSVVFDSQLRLIVCMLWFHWIALGVWLINNAMSLQTESKGKLIFKNSTLWYIHMLLVTCKLFVFNQTNPIPIWQRMKCDKLHLFIDVMS